MKLTFAAFILSIVSLVAGLPSAESRSEHGWISIEDLSTIPLNGTSRIIERQNPSEVITCNNAGTAVDRAPIASVIDDFCGRIMGRQVTNGQSLAMRYSYGTFTVLVGGLAINGCTWKVDNNCGRLLRLPVDRCNVNSPTTGKQGGFVTDVCGQWVVDPGSNGSDF